MDRMGEGKALYWSLTTNKSLIFDFELKALRTHPDYPTEIERNYGTSFIRYNYAPGPYTIYKGVFKLQPGHLLHFGKGTGRTENRIFLKFKRCRPKGAKESLLRLRIRGLGNV